MGTRSPDRRSLLTIGAISLCGVAAPAVLTSVTRKRPNILFFLPDQHRFDWIAGGAIPLRMPHLQSLMKTGTRLQKAIVSSPLCAPSRACLATGKEYGRCGVKNNGQDLPLDQPTFYQSLRESGYTVLGCGKFDLHKASLDWGIDGRRFLPEWGFTNGIDNAGKFDAILSGAVEARDPYMAYLHRRGLAALHVEDFRKRAGGNSYTAIEPTPLPEEAYCDNWIGTNGLELLNSVPTGKPWFLQVNFTGPHDPMDITRRMERSVRKLEYPGPHDSSTLSAEKHNSIRRNYAAMIENIDRWLGVYISELRRRGELENTLIVYSSDHGEMLGDHDRWGKSVPFQPSVCVPLIVSGLGVAKGAVSDALVSNVDLAATFLELASAPRLRDIDSRSLLPLLESKVTSHREFVKSGLDRWRMVYDGRYKLIRGFEIAPVAQKGKQTPPVEPKLLLFDLKLDPQESTNLLRGAPNQVERLNKLLS